MFRAVPVEVPSATSDFKLRLGPAHVPEDWLAELRHAREKDGDAAFIAAHGEEAARALDALQRLAALL